MYRTIEAERIVRTVQRLRGRIQERFPESSLRRVADELVQVTGQAVRRAEWLSRPNYWLRVSDGLLSAVLLVIILVMVRVLRVSPPVDRARELFQALDAALNTLILLPGAAYFLRSIETRFKHARALAQIHEQRALAHVLDRHQLTQDRGRPLDQGTAAKDSPT